MADIRDPEFYLAHASYVHGLARRLVYDAHAADDLFQEAWLAALQRPAQDGAQPRRWLARIVRNLASKAWLRAVRRQQREQHWEPPPSSSSPDAVLAHEQERRRVVDALLALDEPYRATLIARFFDGLEPDQIAARDGLPIETVRTRQKRGLQRLRERLLRGSGSAMALVRGLQLDPPGARIALGCVVRGVILMHTKKLLASAGILLLATIGWLALPAPAPTAKEADDAAAVAAATAEIAPPQVASESPPAAAPAARRIPLPLAAATEAPTGALEVRVTWPDHRPAADIGVQVRDLRAANVEAGVLAGRTGAGGRVRFDRVRASDVWIECNRGEHAQCVVRAGACTNVTLTIPSGIHVRGHVLDVDGNPAGGAVIHMQYRMEPCSGQEVARTDAAGMFAIDDVPIDRAVSLSAFLPMRAPSPQRYVQGVAGATVDVELQFTAHGGAIAGRVVDEHGQAVAGATVSVGRQLLYDAFCKAAGDGPGPPAPSRRTTSYARGEWLVDGFAAGETPVLVVAPGMAPWTGNAFVVVGSTVRCDATLTPSAELAGIVRDEHGLPVANATLRCGRWGLATVCTTSAADGSYALDGLPLGTFTVEAKAEGAGEARAEFPGTTGAQLHWDPVLQRASTLRGRVLADGEPVAKARIDARCMPSAQQQWFGDATSGADGRFEMTNCPDALLHLDVHTDSSAHFTVCMRDDVDPRGGEVVLEVDPDRVPNAFVAGRVLDPVGKPIAGAEVTVLTNDYEWGGGHSVRTDGAGRFRSPAVPPGAWYLTVHADGLAQLSVPARTLPARATEDFGDLVLARGSALVVTLQPDTGIALDDCVVGIVDAMVGLPSGRPKHGVVRFAQLAPGEYTVTAYAPGAALRPLTVHVGTEPEIAVAMRLTAGSEVTIDVRDVRGEPIVDRLETELVDSKGTRIDATPLTPGNGPLLWVRRLVGDRYELRLRDHRQRTATVPFTVPSGGKPVQVTARFP